MVHIKSVRLGYNTRWYVCKHWYDWRAKQALSGEVDESFVLPYMSVCGIYMPYVHNPGVHGRLYGLDLKKGNGRLGKQAMEVARLVNGEENDCRFEVQREKDCIHTRPTWSIAVRERLLELFCG